jgi:hypothetical protein
LENSDFICNTGVALLEKEVLQIMHKEGFSDQQVYEMPLEKLLDLFYGAYLWKANNVICNSATTFFI